MKYVFLDSVGLPRRRLRLNERVKEDQTGLTSQASSLQRCARIHQVLHGIKSKQEPSEETIYITESLKHSRRYAGSSFT